MADRRCPGDRRRDRARLGRGRPVGGRHAAALIRAFLVGLAVAVAIVLLLGALNRLAGDDADVGRARAGETPRDIGLMIRGVRLVFLAVAALAAASGWLLGHPLPLVVALVIAGVDVLETSFLLIVVGLRSRR